MFCTMLTAKIKDTTATRLTNLTGKPVSKSVDGVINDLCDKYEDLRESPTNEKPRCWIDSHDTPEEEKKEDG